ncbi:hypothetical protein Adt_05205 [Abeliophyllum distichum]|uniref:Uncharacterized protein n=1 Tax=Abeliophyllum distichum TaxID=126358 RepID=A0ABD1V3E9_9LAMI
MMLRDGLQAPLSGYVMCRTSIKLESYSSLLGTSGLVNLSDYSPTAPVLKDDKLDGTKEEETIVSRVVSHRDMATQMSPIGSCSFISQRKLVILRDPFLCL